MAVRKRFLLRNMIKIQHTLNGKPSLKNILITLQTPKANESFWHFVDTVIKQTADRYRWWVRSHPGWMAEEKSLKTLQWSGSCWIRSCHRPSALCPAETHGPASHLWVVNNHWSRRIWCPLCNADRHTKEYFLDAFESGIVVSAKTRKNWIRLSSCNFKRNHSQLFRKKALKPEPRTGTAIQ